MRRGRCGEFGLLHVVLVAVLDVKDAAKDTVMRKGNLGWYQDNAPVNINPPDNFP